MSQLKYKTRGMSEPGKKEKVYFCAHPDDFPYFFDSISDEILKRQNCAVWYRDENDPYDEAEHLADLSRMQLVVFPVTTKLLNTASRALDVDFRFAVENNIPVLPLMQESGLDKLFNEKCGDIQYLDKFNRDETAISYEEKLSKFLSEVLIGDELAEKIRDAFDAYVFLSYRKKDRKYAQELMRLIHRNEFCRDIAIWYDEFLTPGENFNDSIKEALEKSGLFVLAVTPNLVNEENYIMTTEYPMAKKEEKPILPAELVSTDKALLREKYKDIPECTDAHNEPALSDALLSAVQKMAIKENDNSPEHNFFIGLAYLSGIDVEVDHNRALKLIKSSAEAGLIEAQEKLISMYMSGDGVRRDFKNAVRWQKKLCRKREEIFREDPTWENLDSWLSCYIGIAGKCSVLNDTHGAIDAYLDLAFVCEQIKDLTADDRHLDRTRLRFKAEGYMYASNGYKALGRAEKAIEYPKKALAILEPLYNEEFNQGSVWVKKDYANCLSYVGETYRITNELDTALSYFEKANVIKKELFEFNKNIKDIRFDTDYVLGLSTVAGIHLLKFENDKAEENYRLALSVLEKSEEENKTWETVPLYTDISLSYSTLYRAAGDFRSLEAIISDALDKINDYKKGTGVMLYYSAFRAIVFLAQSYVMQKKFDLGKEKLFEALELNREYFRICRRDIDLSMICTCYTLLANVHLESGELDFAKEYIEKAVGFADKDLESGFSLYAADCAAAYSLYSSIELMRDNTEHAKALLKKAISILEENSFSIEDTRAIPMFFVAYLNYSAICFDSGDFRGNAEYGMKALESFKKYKALAPGIAASSNISLLCYTVAMSKCNLDKNEGREFIMNMCDYFEKCLEAEQTMYNYDGLATMYFCLSGITGIFERGKWRKKAVKIIELMERTFGADFEKSAVNTLLNQ